MAFWCFSKLVAVDTQGSLKFSSRRFECVQNRSAPFLTLFSIAPEIYCLGQYRAVVRVKEKKYHISLAARLPVSTMHMCRQCHELWTYYCIGHTLHCRPIAAAWTHHKEACNGNILARLKCRRGGSNRGVLNWIIVCKACAKFLTTPPFAKPYLLNCHETRGAWAPPPPCIRPCVESTCLYHQTIDRYDQEQTSPLALLDAWWPAGLNLETCSTLRCSFENAFLWPPLLVHIALQFWSIVSLLNLYQSASFVPSGMTRTI